MYVNRRMNHKKLVDYIKINDNNPPIPSTCKNNISNALDRNRNCFRAKLKHGVHCILRMKQPQHKTATSIKQSGSRV